jgi:caffeoyl-CoA O-methyltransferase
MWTSKEADVAQSDDFRTLLGEIDGYIEELFASQDESLEAAVRESQRAGLPEIQVSPNEGKLLQLLAEVVGARRVLEIGALGGYSAINLARGMTEDGTLISLEIDERRAEVARHNVEHAGLGEMVEIRGGDARELLAELVEENEEPFDLVFIDADKQSYPEYLEWAIWLSRPGSLILGDNTIWGGSVLDPQDNSTRAIREFNEKLAKDPRLSAIVLPLIRERVDGLAIARVRNL